jgi:hypothetical protein
MNAHDPNLIAPLLQTATGEPPQAGMGRFFRDDQGEIFEPDNPQHRSAVAIIGVLPLDNGQWLVRHNGFSIDNPQFPTREAALRCSIARKIKDFRRFARQSADQGIHWDAGAAGRMIEWALSLKPSVARIKSESADEPQAETQADSCQQERSQDEEHLERARHPRPAHSAQSEASDAEKESAGPPAHITDPVVAELVAQNKARKVYPAGHVVHHTIDYSDPDKPMSIGACDCGASFAYRPSQHHEMDAAIEAHWQKFDKGDDHVHQEPALQTQAEAAPREERAEARGDEPIATEASPPAQSVAPETAGAVANPALAGSLPDDPDWMLKLAEKLAWKDEDDAPAIGHKRNGEYRHFLESKIRLPIANGFDITGDALNPALKPFQRDIVRWALKRGRAAIFAGTGLGKTIQQLSWADQIVSRFAGPVLILTPLAVAQQTVAEAERFSIASVAYARSQAEAASSIVVTNYERLEKFDASKFAGIVLDESSILKAFDGKTRQSLIETFAETQYRLCCTATPAPNDYVELGNHAEFLGILQHKEMLATWFVHDGSSRATNIENHGLRQGSDWRLKGHAEDDFWRWLASWSVLIRHPRDLGYEEAGYDLPALNKFPVTIKTKGSEGLLEPQLARTLQERLAARRNTLTERVAAAAAIVNSARDRQWLVWCNLNDESSALTQAIPGAIEVRGSDDPDVKAARLLGFARGEHQILISKPSIAGWGMNFQRCADMVFVGLNDSFEQLYQAIRRCWRFGQTRAVNVHLVAADVEGAVVANLEAKEEAADYMAASMAEHMRDLTAVNLRPQRTISIHDKPMQVPQWLT